MKFAYSNETMHVLNMGRKVSYIKLVHGTDSYIGNCWLQNELDVV